MVTYWISQLGQLDDPDNGYTRSYSSLHHDAYNVALIDELSGNSQHFIDTPAWFLTTDRALVRLQRIHYQRKDKIPFCIMPSQLLQILRFTTAKDGAYDKAFLGLFSRSFVPSSVGLPTEMVQEILARVAKYKGTPNLADKVLSDTLFVRRYRGTADEGERDELLHDALIAKAKELETALADRDARLASLEQEAAKLQDVATQHESGVKHLQQVIESKDSTFEAQQAVLQAKLQAVQDQLRETEEARQAAEEARRIAEETQKQAVAAREAAEARERENNEKKEATSKARKRYYQSGLTLVLFFLPLLIPATYVDWPNLGKVPKAVVQTLPFVGFIMASYRAFGTTRGGWISMIVGLFFTVFAALYSLQ
jgi:hypothetical protein